MQKKVDKILIIIAITVVMLGILLVLINCTSIKTSVKNSEQMKVNYSIEEENTWDVSKNGDGSVIATLSEEGTLTFSGIGDMDEWKFYDTPWYEMRLLVRKAIIEEGVTNIGYGAFLECSELKIIEISASVISINLNAFNICRNLTDIKVKEGNTEYCDINGVLYSKDKTKIIKYPMGREGKEYTILNTVTNVGYAAFEMNDNLVKIIIPNSVIDIEEYAFVMMNNLMTIEISDSVASIGKYAFNDCYSLKNIKVTEGNTKYCDVNGVLYSKDKTKIIKYPMGREEKEYTILNTVTHIGEKAFEFCYNLVKIVIPNGVTDIEEYAFDANRNLMDLEIPGSVINIGNNAFYGCEIINFVNIDEYEIEIPKIFERTLNENDILYSEEGSTFENCIIENGKIKISEEKASIEIKSGLLKGLRLIIVYNSWDVSKLGDRSIMATIEENGVLTISGSGEMRDFKYYEDNFPWVLDYFVRKVEIQEGVTYVDIDIFSGNWLLTDIKVDSNNKQYCDVDGVLYTKDKTELIVYPALKKGDKYSILSDVKIIQDGAFSLNMYLKNIEIPNGVVEIGNYAFTYCGSLKNIIIPKSVTTIGKDLFGKPNYVRILCYKDSDAETYAKEEEIPYEIIYLSSVAQKIDEQNLTIKLAEPETTIEKLKVSLQSDIPYEILDNIGNVIEDTSAFVGTGYYLKLSNGQKYTIILKGDINGDGKVKLSDLSKLKLVIIGKIQLEEIFEKVADLNEDENVKLSDLSKMKLYLVGKSTL